MAKHLRSFSSRNTYPDFDNRTQVVSRSYLTSFHSTELLIFQRETSYQKIPTDNAMAQIYRRSNKILLGTIPTVIKKNYRRIKENWIVRKERSTLVTVNRESRVSQTPGNRVFALKTSHPVCKLGGSSAKSTSAKNTFRSLSFRGPIYFWNFLAEIQPDLNLLAYSLALRSSE